MRKRTASTLNQVRNRAREREPLGLGPNAIDFTEKFSVRSYEKLISLDPLMASLLIGVVRATIAFWMQMDANG